MAKILIGIVAVLACFYLAESLTCNKCTVSLFGFCLGTSTETCSTNTSVCYTTQATFTDITSFKGFSKQGCIESSNCPNNSVITTGTLGGSFLNIGYTITTACCSTDKCNPVDLSGASTNAMSLSVTLSAAVLAAVWGTYM